MVDVHQHKCACNDCTCIVTVEEAIKKTDGVYCSTACADGHPSGQGCGHAHCGCGAQTAH